MATTDNFILQLFEEGAPLTPEVIAQLGPLAGFYGDWESDSGSGTGWNVIAVPGNDISIKPPKHIDLGFVLEVIPYYETLSFRPALVAANRMGRNNDPSATEYNAALIYEQAIFSDCASDFCARRGFTKGSMIHRESGMLMNMTGVGVGTLPIVRMGEIPHGNSVMALGSASLSANAAPVIDPNLSTFPFNDDHAPFKLGYAETQYKHDVQFPGVFDQLNPNTQLISANAGKTFAHVVQVHVDTQTPEGGGILNIPFITNHVNTTQLTADFWLATLAGDAIPKQLQYSQTINLKFASSDTLGLGKVINWPHVTLNTLKRVR